MPYCPNCGVRQSDAARFCEACGSPMSAASAPPVVHDSVHPATVQVQPPPSRAARGPLVCPGCGTTLEPDSLFCDMCGVRLNVAAGAGVTPPPTVPDLSPAPSAPGGSATAASPQARLIVQATQETLHLPYGKAEVIIGRDDPVGNLFPDIDLTDCGGDKAGVSRQHARIFFQGGQVFVEDRNSTNHTYVNGHELVPWQPHPLKNGDEIKFGRLSTVFYL